MKRALDLFQADIEEIRRAGTYKSERVIESPQSSAIVTGGKRVLNFCANNYLGLANDARLKEAARQALDDFGMGLSSVRFICGTQTLHKQLENKIAGFLRAEDAILYTSCFDANGGLFETLLGEGDAIVSDALNHASIIDGIRLCKAQRFRYQHADMKDLEASLKKAREGGARKTMVATDGVFSMDGDVARLGEICALAENFDALVMVDDSHATGFFGPTGRGAIEECGVMDRVDVITSPLGKALGALPAGSPLAGSRSSNCFGKGAGPISSAIRSRPPWSARPSGALNCFRKARSCVTGWRRTRPISASGSPRRDSISSRALIRSFRSCWATRNWRSGWRTNC